MSGIEYIKTDLSKHPQCVHGPTFLFSKNTKSKESRFFACSACRDRKDCPFFLQEGDKYNKEIIKQKQINYVAHINPDVLGQTLDEIYELPESERKYCQTCNKFILNDVEKHENHEIKDKLTNEDLENPSQWIKLRENDKKEAQYLFSSSTIDFIVNVLKDQKITNVLCIGTPRIHEYIRAKCKGINSLLMDIEDRYHHFYKPEEFCWYNLFNHYFFIPESKKYYERFLKQGSGEKTLILIDPPFGGRTEPISQTLDKINEDFKSILAYDDNLPVLFFMPYFMEQHIKNHISYLEMADFKVDYDNHSCFTSGPKARKKGSPVRMYTNIPLSKLVFYSEGYHYCDICKKYVYNENKHCYLCNSCTSKDGSTYVHCNKCMKCIKPSWVHCSQCKKCAQKDHKCEEEIFEKSCFHCHEKGHKRSDCPNIDNTNNKRKRKQSKKFIKKLKPE